MFAIQATHFSHSSRSGRLLRTLGYGLLLAACIGVHPLASAADISGAGSSGAKMLYAKWAEVYKIKLNYQASGSSDGIKQIKAKAVDFGATDVAMTADELKKDGLILFPSAISGVVPFVNLPKIREGDLKLTGEVLADIFAHKISKWDDPAIAALNPGLSLPKTAIITVARQDGSGTTYNFTDYLSAVSPAWKAGFGKNFSIKWPTDTIAVKGSGDVVTAVKQNPGAIGYVDHKYIAQDKLAFVQLKNREGKFVSPGPKGFESALNNSPWRGSGSFEDSLTNRAGQQTWPITAGTFILVPQNAKNPASTIAMLKFFSWAFIKGDHLADSADFVALPDAVQARVFKEMMKVRDDKGKPLEWSPL